MDPKCAADDDRLCQCLRNLRDADHNPPCKHDVIDRMTSKLKLCQKLYQKLP